MEKDYWKQVRARAWSEALASAKVKGWGAVFALFFLALFSAGATFLFSANPSEDIWLRAAATIGGPFLLALGYYAVAFVRVPPAREDELRSEHGNEIAALKTRIAAAEAQAAKTREPPPRDPNGIYQFGKLVGEAHGALRSLHAGSVRFAALKCGAEFNSKVEFEYQDLLLLLAGWTGLGTMATMNLMTSQTYTDATCTVRGRAKGAT